MFGLVSLTLIDSKLKIALRKLSSLSDLQIFTILKLLYSGKTSVVKYLAGLAGTKVIRINNHEHTDLQEYVGSYCVGENDKLAFKEGSLQCC